MKLEPQSETNQGCVIGLFLWLGIAVFVIWLIANNVGDNEPLLFDPVNAWTGTLILAIALDLARQHAPEWQR